MPAFTEDRARLQELISKYGYSIPRYTSYPTAPEWKDQFSQDIFEEAIKRSNKEGKDFSLYLHIPFCEAQCYYCGCNVVISPEHGIENPYLQKLKDEISYYGERFDSKRKVIQMAWGGGTPTYLRPEQIIDLYNHIAKSFSLYQDSANQEYAIEIDPRVTTKDHLQALYQCGFNRLSMGVQDFNLKTQETINRIQSFEQTATLVEEARRIGFTSINLDLIYGLPYQSLETFTDTIAKIKIINPERIALFNYAHIPSIFPYQKKYIPDDSLANAEEKLKIFTKAIEEFTDFGYEFIGLDHFAKPNDGLALAQKNRSLYRNFQGYTTHAGCDLLGLGISSISDIQGVYKQSPKKLNAYYEDIFTAEKFMVCSEEDRERREIIKQLMCNNYVVISASKYSSEIAMLEDYVGDKLVSWTKHDNSGIYIEISELGRYFVRNIASVFDSYLRADNAHRSFSKSL